MQNGELILYQTADGQAQISLKAIDGSVWLNQNELAELFSKARSTVVEHIQNIFKDKELQTDSVCREFRQTAADGKDYSVTHYNLDMILAIGYRIRSARGVQFRQWANTVLKEYLVKGFAMDDQRLKQAEQWDYFDEWLERIRDISASEKRFYQKIKDLYITAVDYDKTSEDAQLFFKKIQNKMLWAVTGKTAAELIAKRSDSNATNMGVTSWKGEVVRKGDIGIAKNYLSKQEIEELNRIVTMYLDYAEDQAKKRNTISMQQWSEKLDTFLSFNERELLTHAGKIRMEVAKKIATERYDEFNQRRVAQAKQMADEQDISELEAIEAELLKKD